MRVVRILRNGIILNRSAQVLGYVDDIDIVGRSILEIKEAFFKLENAARYLSLVVNEYRTKLMVVSPPPDQYW